jgi:OFA family oxalate/formate antiporter-like MFS transporter
MEPANFPFGDFLAFLKQQGFSIGIDHYLRLQTVLNLLGPDCDPADLKYILCPIFAVNEKQQRQFHGVFDRYFEVLSLSGKKLAAASIQEEKAVEPLDTSPVVRRWPYFIPILIFLGVMVFLFIQQQPKDQEPVNIPPQRDEKQSPIPQPASSPWTLIHYLGIATPIIIFLIMELRRREQRRLILERQRGKKPPFVWPIKCELPELGFLKGESFYAAMRRLKRRLISDVLQLDIDATIDHTIQTGGFPRLRYRALTKPPEYFMLVDLPAVRDHYARMVDHIVDAMKFEGILITRYFYDRDPRVCFNDYFTERVYLNDLKARFDDCRLIVFGDCEEFLDPVSGDLERWVSLLQTWQDRVVLTPVPPKQWGWREATLAEEFLILPTSVDGLAVMGEHLSGFAVSEVTNRPSNGGRTSYAGEEVSSLRASLGEDVFQWLCACAIFPQLHYDLSLFLGGLPCMSPGLLSEENIQSLFRLGWFRTGSIPDDKRVELINKLDKDKSQAVRRALIDVLYDNPPPKGTFARDTWSMNIVLQQWMLSPQERRNLKKLANMPDSVGEKAVLEDYTALQLIESAPTSLLKIIIPRRLYKIFFRKGLPLFGFSTLGRAFLAVLAAFSIYAFMAWPLIIVGLSLLIAFLSVLYILGKIAKQFFSAVWQALKGLRPLPSEAETPIPEERPIPAQTAVPVVIHPARAWVVVFAGFAVNLCLGILYAWSVWAKALIDVPKAGQMMTGVNEGWVYLTNAEATTPFSLCVLIFGLFMIPGGRIQDRFGPKIGAIAGGLFLAFGCIFAGLSKSYSGLILGFGLFGGIGMGLGYAAAMPAAVKWFGPHKRGLAAGLVTGGYGAAALYISPLAAYLLAAGGITYSFIWLGIFFAVVVIFAGSLLASPPQGYVPPATPAASKVHSPTTVDWAASDMLKTWRFYALVFMFIGTTMSGLMIIANSFPIFARAAKESPLLSANIWILASFGGLVNGLGRVGTGFYSDKIGRANAYTLNGLVCAICLFLLPEILATGGVGLMFLAIGIAYWQYGGGLALMPTYTADFFGTKNLGFNYSLVFFGWGLGFFMTRLGGVIKDITGTYDLAFYLSAIFLIISVLICRVAKQPRPTTRVKRWLSVILVLVLSGGLAYFVRWNYLQELPLPASAPPEPKNTIEQKAPVLPQTKPILPPTSGIKGGPKPPQGNAPPEFNSTIDQKKPVLPPTKPKSPSTYPRKGLK